MRQLRLILIVFPVLACAGCFADAGKARWNAYGTPHKVTVYNGGQVIREFHTEGKELTESDFDGWYFKDKSSGKLVRVSGTVIIEQE